MIAGIKNIIFDFGGIIVDLDKQAAIDAFCALGFPDADLVDDYVQRGIFAAIETGQMSGHEFCNYVRERSGKDLPDATIVHAWTRMLAGIPPYRIKKIKELRKHYRTFLLSNTNAMHWEYSVQEQMPATGYKMEDCFEQTFLSYRMGIAKPDPEIFRRALHEAGLLPEETLFIDDSQANCQAAASLGIHTFHSQLPEDWMELFKEETGT